MATNIFQGDLQVSGSVVAGGVITSSTAWITNSQIQSGAAIDATKCIQQHQYSLQLFASTTAISAVTQLVGGIRGTTSSLVELWAAVITAPTTTDTVSIDLKRSTSGGAFATTLAATLDFDSSSTAKTIYTATPTATLVQGDLLEIVVTVSGTSAQGLIVGWTTRETAT